MASYQSNFISRILLAYIFLSSGLIVNLLQFLVLPLWYLGYRNKYRQLIVELNRLLWCLIPGLAQWWAGVEVYMHGTPEDFEKLGHETAICIMNHKGQLDWIVSWIVSDFCQILGNAKCIMKNSLRYIPMLGWSFWFAEYIFIQRKLEKDRSALDRGFKNLCGFEQDFWMLIFCEGTRFTPEKYKLGVKYAEENGIKPYKYHLVPRTKGFTLMTRGLRQRVAAVYDATVCFRDETDLTLAGMVNGEPSRADFIIRRLPIWKIPEDESASTKYVHDIYYEKDRVCEYHKFGGDFHKSDWKSPFYEDHVIRKIPTNMKTNLTLLMWTSLTLFALFYYVTSTLLFGTWFQIGVITAVASIVAAMFYFMMELAKPKTS